MNVRVSCLCSGLLLSAALVLGPPQMAYASGAAIGMVVGSLPNAGDLPLNSAPLPNIGPNDFVFNFTTCNTQTLAALGNATRDLVIVNSAGGTITYVITITVTTPNNIVMGAPDIQTVFQESASNVPFEANFIIDQSLIGPGNFPSATSVTVNVTCTNLMLPTPPQQVGSGGGPVAGPQPSVDLEAADFAELSDDFLNEFIDDNDPWADIPFEEDFDIPENEIVDGDANEETEEIEDDPFEPEIADDPGHEERGNRDATLRNRLAQLEAALAAEKAKLAALEKGVKDAQDTENTALEEWRDADKTHVEEKKLLAELQEDKKKLLDKEKALEETFNEKQAEWEDKKKHLDSLRNAIDELTNVALGLKDDSDAFAERAKNDAWNAAVQAATAAATAGLGKAIDKVAGDYVDRVAGELAEQGQKLTKEQRNQLLIETTQALQATAGAAGEAVIGEGADALSAEGNTTLDSLSVDVPFLGDIGVSDLGNDAVDFAVNVGGAFGNLLSAIGAGQAGSDVADQITEMERSFARFVGDLERQNEGLLNELQSLSVQLDEVEVKRNALAVTITQAEADVETAVQRLNQRGEALLEARQNTRDAQAALAREAPAINQEISRLESQIINVRAQLSQQRNSSLAPSRNSNSRFAFASHRRLRGKPPQFESVFALNQPSEDFGPLDFRGFHREGPWTVWTRGTIGGSRRSITNADNNGFNAQIDTGATFDFSDRFSFGASVAFKLGNTESEALDNEFNARSMSGTIYSTIRLFEDVKLDPILTYEAGTTDVRIGTVTGDFSFNALTTGIRVRRRFNLPNEWWLEPSTGVVYTFSERDGYVNSNGTSVPGSESTFGRVNFGPRLGKTFDFSQKLNESDDGKMFDIIALTPTFGLTGSHAFERPEDSIAANGIILPISTTSFSLSSSVSAAFVGGITANLSGSYTFATGSTQSWSVSGGVDVPVSVFLGNKQPSAGRLTLNAFTSAGSFAGGRFGLRMPF